MEQKNKPFKEHLLTSAKQSLRPGTELAADMLRDKHSWMDRCGQSNEANMSAKTVASAMEAFVAIVQPIYNRLP